MGDVVLLLGLEEPLDLELQRVLRTENRTVHISPSQPTEVGRDLIARLRPNLVFLGGDWRSVVELLRAAAAPVVVVSPRPEIADWLDAIEAGAADYCAPPFESSHLRWILESASKSSRVLAA